MKSSKYFLIFGGAVFSLLFLSLFVVSIALFKSVDQGGGELRLAPILASIEDQMKSAKSADDVKHAFKSFESITGLGSGSEPAEKLQKVFSPLAAHFGNKPREAEPHHLLIKKRDFLEISLNGYRKEIPRGDIRVRALLLNIIFDTQNSFLNESAEMEQVYIRHTHERIAALRSLAGRDAGLLARISIIENSLGIFEKAFAQSQSWQDQRTELLAKSEKSLASLLQDLKRNNDGGLESSRRAFFYSSFFSAIVVALCMGLLLLGYRIIGGHFSKRASLLARYLRQFGQEKRDLLSRSELDLLRKDEEWGELLALTQAAEEEFIQSYQTQLSVSKAVTLPFFVLTKDRAALFWNAQAAQLFDIPEKKAGVSLDDIISVERMSSTQGEIGGLIEMIRNSFSAPKEDIFEFYIKQKNGEVPVELVSSPINSGPLIGGKLFVYRPIRNEAARIDQAVAVQLNYTRDLVHKLTHGYEVDISATGSFTAPVKAMLSDLSSMKLKLDERETLWKSESTGLLDQANRQREILDRLGAEIHSMRSRHEELARLFSAIYDTEEDKTDEIRTIERSLAAWIENRKRLKSDLEAQARVLKKARSYEGSLRDSVAAINSMLKEVRTDLVDLQRFREEARLQAINLSFAESNASPGELSSKARAYANQLGNFCDRLRKISDGLETLVHAHPGGALLPHLESADIDESVLVHLQDEHLKLSACLEKWKLSGEEILSGGERALELLSGIDKIGATASQLGETSTLINEQTKVNLARWQ